MGHCPPGALQHVHIEEIFRSNGASNLKYSLFLDWPPSVNHVWRKFSGRIVLDPRVKTFRLSTASRVAVARARGELAKDTLSGDVAVKLVLLPPDKRKRDLDNYCKALFDALTFSRVWYDDHQIQMILMAFGEQIKFGLVKLTIEELSDGWRKRLERE